MYLSAYHFDGDPTELTAAYEQLVRHIPPDNALLQTVAVGESGISIIDACPDRATHEHFVVSPEFRAALTAAGLPEPRVQVLGDVTHAYVDPSAVTLVGSSVPA